MFRFDLITLILAVFFLRFLYCTMWPKEEQNLDTQFTKFSNSKYMELCENQIDWIFFGFKVTSVLVCRRVARIWKRGGYFERVRKVQTTLTRILIVLESVSHGLSENSDEISRKARKFEGFLRPKPGGLQKKKKGLRRNWVRFFGRNPEFEGFFRPKPGGLQKKKKGVRFFSRNPKFKGFFRPKPSGKKRSSPKLSPVFGQMRKFKRFREGCFLMGGLFSIFHKKRPQKHEKRAILNTSQANGGAQAPPAPPPGYATACV